jgi:ABC-type spermidine/putrescine transport system permease subunit II
MTSDMFLSADNLQALWLTFQVAALTTLILLLLGTPLTQWLVGQQQRLVRRARRAFCPPTHLHRQRPMQPATPLRQGSPDQGP